MRFRRALGTAALVVTTLLAGACDDIIGANDATIVVENEATAAVYYMYITDCGDDWGADELGSSTIPVGGVRRFGVSTGCHDVRAVFSDGSEALDFGIDLDEGDEFTWVLTD